MLHVLQQVFIHIIKFILITMFRLPFYLVAKVFEPFDTSNTSLHLRRFLVTFPVCSFGTDVTTKSRNSVW